MGFKAEFENGEVVDGLSEDRLFMMMGRMVNPGNSTIVIEPTGKEKWYVVIGLLDSGEYEVEFRDPRLNEHRVLSQSSKGEIALEVTIWLSEREGMYRRDRDV